MTLKKTLAASAALLMAALSAAAASAACLNRTDMHALQAAAVQQKLMVAAFTCQDSAAYNRFVLSHRGELQKSDATLMAFFKRGSGGVAAYHTYKTHLANASALSSSRDDGFCGDASALFRRVSRGGSLDDVLDSMPTAGTGYSACYVASAAPSTRQRTVRSADADAVAPSSRDVRRASSNETARDRRYARNRWRDERGYDRGPAWDDEDSPRARDRWDPRDDADDWSDDDRDGYYEDGPPDDDRGDW